MVVIKIEDLTTLVSIYPKVRAALHGQIREKEKAYRGPGKREKLTGEILGIERESNAERKKKWGIPDIRVETVSREENEGGKSEEGSLAGASPLSTSALNGDEQDIEEILAEHEAAEVKTKEESTPKATHDKREKRRPMTVRRLSMTGILGSSESIPHDEVQSDGKMENASVVEARVSKLQSQVDGLQTDMEEVKQGIASILRQLQKR